MNRELFRFDEISIRGLVNDLFRNIWMILVAGLTMLFLTVGWHNLAYEPQYTSSATLVVTIKGGSGNYSSLSLASQLASVFGQVFQSDALRERIEQDTGENIKGTISCNPVSQTNLLVLSVTCSNPRQAYVFINAALQHYEEVAGNVFANSALQIVQAPEVPKQPSNTSWVLCHRYILAGLAMFAMMIIICLFYTLRFTVKTPIGASRQLDGKVWGTIPYETKEGILKRIWYEYIGLTRRKYAVGEKWSLLLDSPVVTMRFAEAVRQTETRLEYHLKKKKAKILLVTSVMENEGKSTVAANLALALGEKHKKVLLIDGDLLKPAMHKLFEEEKGAAESLSDLLDENAVGKDIIRYDNKYHIWKLFQYHRAEDPASVMNTHKLSIFLESWKQKMDYVIIDCSPVAASTDAEIWMNAVDSVLFVVREDCSDIRMINDAVDAVWQNGKDFAGFILNAFHREWFQRISGSGYDSYGYGSIHTGNEDNIKERGRTYAGTQNRH